MYAYLLYRLRFITLAVLLAILALPVYAQERISVRAVVENPRPAVGEPFLLQIQVQGSDQASVPDISPLRGFSAIPAGGGSTNQNRVTVINGNVRRETNRGYAFNYQLTLTRPGDYAIPSLTVMVDGVAHRTQAIQLQAANAPLSSDFKVRLELPRTTIYKGETIPVRMVWYVGKQPERFYFSAPLLQQSEFQFSQPELPPTNQQERILGLRINNEEAWGEIGQATLDGSTWSTITVTRFLTPQKSGVFDLSPVSVSGTMIAGYEKTSRTDPFADMFGDDSPFGRQGVLKKFFAASKPVTLTVLELPAQGRPANFSGLVGRYSIAAKVEPAVASVGEPLTLTVMLTGSEYLENVELPDLSRQADLASDFRIPSERAAGKIVGGVKVFTQMIRARNADVKVVPPLQISFFNPESHSYEMAQTRTLPLTIHASKKITTSDIEGLTALPQEGAAVASASGGIYHNYIDDGCLACAPDGIGHWLDTPGWLLLLSLPPASWLLLVVLQGWLHRRERNSPQRLQQAALRNFQNALRQLIDVDNGTSALLVALRQYFCQRLSRNAPGLSYADIVSVLIEGGAQAQDMDNLRKVFDRCEASSYAGGAAAQRVSAQQAAAISALAERLDRILL